ncbi:hypothetical protein [Ferrovibrio terrae]|uniref:hypothetical protein n=1 Tax=Ferrovibrio terrae TaxID=2594003 RepID=UPI003137D5C6
MNLTDDEKQRIVKMAASGWPSTTMNRLLPATRYQRARKARIEAFLAENGLSLRSNQYRAGVTV